MAGQVDRFWKELSRTYRAAGSPSLETMLAWGRECDPPVWSSTSTVNDWLSGKTIPGAVSKKFFMIMVTALEGRAKDRASGEGGWTEREWVWWEELLTAARTERAPGTAAGPVQLPTADALFVGREEPLGRLMDWLAPAGRNKDAPGPQEDVEAPAPAMTWASVLEVTGMGGVGKTALAVEAARQAVKRGFPGGVLFADLRGHSAGQDVVPEETLDAFVRTLRPREEPLSVPAEKVRRWRRLLDELAAQEKPLLIVLDNVRQAGGLTDLFPSLPHRALVTSRHTHPDAIRHRVVLAPFPQAEAELFVRHRLAEPGDGQITQPEPGAEAAHDEHVWRIAQLCGRLPLALRIVVALLRAEPDRSLRERVDELADNLLDGMEDDDTDAEGRPLAVRACFALCYKHLTEPRARAFRLLAAAPGQDISTASAAVLLGLPLNTARLSLRGLAGMHLLDRSRRGGHELAEADREHWSMHDLIRLYAEEHGHACAAEDDRHNALDRLLRHYREAAGTGVAIPIVRDISQAFSVVQAHRRAEVWLETERINVVAAATSAPASPWRVELALQLDVFFATRRYFPELTRLAQSAIEACQQGYGDRYQEFQAHGCLARALSFRGHCNEALAVLDAAEEVAADLEEQACGIVALERGTILMEANRLAEAIRSYDKALEYFQHAGDAARAGAALTCLGSAWLYSGQPENAAKCSEAAVNYCQMADDQVGEVAALKALANAQSALGQHEEAINSLRFVTRYAEITNDVTNNIDGSFNLGLAFHRAGQREEALKHLRDAEELARMFVHHEETLGVVLVNLGTVLKEHHQLKDACAQYAEATEIFRALGDTQRLAGTEHQLRQLRQALAREKQLREALGRTQWRSRNTSD